MYYLFVWSIVIQYPYDSRAGHTPSTIVNEWKNQGEFANEKVCQDAAKKLNITTGFRCIYSKPGV